MEELPRGVKIKQWLERLYR